MANESEKARKIKGKLPTKTYINLVYSEKETGRFFTLLLMALAFFALLAVFTKFLVLDQIEKVNLAREQYYALQTQLEKLKAENKGYSDVESQFNHYGTSYLQAEELALADREEILDVINSRIDLTQGLTSITLSGNTATVELTSLNMEEISAIVESLEESDSVSYVVVDTASTDDSRISSRTSLSDRVNASITIEFKSPAGTDASSDSDSASLTDTLAARKEAAENTGEG